MNRQQRFLSLFAIQLILSVPLFAQNAAHTVEIVSGSAALEISGSVVRRVAIAVEGVGRWNNLDLTVDVEAEVVARVTEYSNARHGYRVGLSSANQGRLVGVAAGESLPYRLTYDGELVDMASPISMGNGKTARAGRAKALAISYAGEEAGLVSDLYSDDLTFTIIAE